MDVTQRDYIKKEDSQVALDIKEDNGEDSGM